MNYPNDKAYLVFKSNMAKLKPHQRKTFLKFLLKKEVYEKYISNCLEGVLSPILAGWINRISYNDIISYSFTWKLTKEGYTF